MRRSLLALLTLSILAAAGAAFADEGMWTFHDFPGQAVQKRYGFNPDQAWLDKARRASARIAEGCSASFVSGEGLVMTNHHCVHSCIEQLSTAQSDYIKHGFVAKTRSDEAKCPNFEVQRLDKITDVTDRVAKATAGKEGAAHVAALREISATLEKECQVNEQTRCELVDLFHGGQFVLHAYHRYTDVRIAFAPELQAAFFGGDPDNFEFPRYDLDAAFVRVYEGGKPAATPDHFTWSKAGAKDGELTFVSGNPGRTDRELTMAQLEFERDVRNPMRLAMRAEWRGVLTEYGRKGDEERRTTTEWLFSIENSLKAYKGRIAALADKVQLAKKQQAEDTLRQKIAADPKLAKSVGNAYQDIEKALTNIRPYFRRYWLIEPLEKGDLLGHAITLVRAAEERGKADGKRLDEYRDAALPAMEQAVTSAAPIYAARERLVLAFWLGKLREELGGDDPTIKALLGKETPEAVAARWVAGSKLGDVAERSRLWKEGKKGIAASKDPIIAAAKLIDGPARKLRKKWEDEVEGVVNPATEKIATARFAVLGRSGYPDATFTLRLSYGAVKGYFSTAHGTKVTPFTTMGGAFRRATGAPPYDLPASWLAAEKSIDGKTPFNFATTNDIIGGNSGSPVFNQALEIVGLIFDGNIESLAGDFWFDESVNRAVAVHSSGILHALEKIYKADQLATELRRR